MSHEQGAHKSWVSRICYAIGNLGQAAYYNALSTFFVTYYAAQTLFRDYEAEEATAMIGIITALVFIIRIVEIWLTSTRVFSSSSSSSSSWCSTSCTRCATSPTGA